MSGAIGFGALAASSLLLGALLGQARPWPPRAIGLVLGFGAGALIAAVSFELAEEGVEVGGPAAVGIGLAVGALTYYVADGLASGEGVSVGLLGAIFVSNLPEAIGASNGMRAAGHSRARIARLWLGVTVVLTLATVAGFAIADSASDALLGGVNGFAAGALIVMLVDSMVPEATRQAGRTTGLITTLGFALAAGLSGVAS